MSTKKSRKSGSDKSGARGGPRMPRKVTGRRRGLEREEGGPRGWLLPTREATYTRLVMRDSPGAGLAAAAAGAAFPSALQPGAGAEVLAEVPEDHWVNVLAEYKQRKAASVLESVAASAPGPPGPIVSGQKNWAPLGPSVVLEGQAYGSPPIGGRVSGIAVAPGGLLVYAATANGGVFRSDDGGVSWRSLMDAFDLDPTQFASTSLACGAIALDPADPRRVYVGTGEGDTHGIFKSRLINALPAYRGIGPIRTDDGERWKTEPTAAGSPTLAGKAFYALAVDPSDRENVIGATTEGLYQRVRTAGEGAEWVRRRAGVFTSVVVASAGGTRRFFAAKHGGGVYRSSDGVSWSALGSNFPTTKVARISLAVQPDNPNLVYAFVADPDGKSRGLFRLDGVSGAWKEVSSLPVVLPVDDGESQGDYDLAVAVDPVDAGIVYLGGSYLDDSNDQSIWPASIWRCRVQPTASGYRVQQGVSIGKHAHADVHVLVHAPGDPNALWAGCDGGLFLNRAPRTTGTFASRNNGNASLCTNFFAQHPTDPGIIFCGLQDNGTATTSGGPIWRNVGSGDGGYCLINWANPQQVLIFANGTIYRNVKGGAAGTPWQEWEFDWELMTEPIVGTPYNPSAPAEAGLVALGAGSRIYLSKNFGASWLPGNVVDIPEGGAIFAIAFASARRFYVGTTDSYVFRVDAAAGGAWTVSRIDNAAGGALPVERGLISDVGVDWADSQLRSVYISFGGVGDFRHVWHFDGTRWEARSGQPGAKTNLLDVEHNAIVVDRSAPANVYVGADIGVWHSPDGGANWRPLPNGLPDAPVFDLQIHPTRRLLRASTHGRGLYEFPLD